MSWQFLKPFRFQRKNKRNAHRFCWQNWVSSHLSDQKASVLSGGERRRLEITRCLVTDPSFILLDEPFAGIDPLAVIDIKKIIVHLRKRDIGILISDHNVRETLEVCDKAYILNNGVVIASGTPDHIASSEVARRIYFGDEFHL